MKDSFRHYLGILSVLLALAAGCGLKPNTDAPMPVDPEEVSFPSVEGVLRAVESADGEAGPPCVRVFTVDVNGEGAARLAHIQATRRRVGAPTMILARMPSHMTIDLQVSVAANGAVAVHAPGSPRPPTSKITSSMSIDQQRDAVFDIVRRTEPKGVAIAPAQDAALSDILPLFVGLAQITSEVHFWDPSLLIDSGYWWNAEESAPSRPPSPNAESLTALREQIAKCMRDTGSRDHWWHGTVRLRVDKAVTWRQLVDVWVQVYRAGCGETSLVGSIDGREVELVRPRVGKGSSRYYLEYVQARE